MPLTPSVRSSLRLFTRGPLLGCALLFALFSPSGSAQQPSSVPVSASTLSLLPREPVAAGTAVKLTAQAAGAPITAGEVLFCDAEAPVCADTALLGSAHLTAAGTASITRVLGAGTHRVKAVLLPRLNAPRSNAQSITSAPLTVTVNGAGSYSSSTGLTASGTAGNYSLAASVTAFGRNLGQTTVSFLDQTTGNSTVGTAALDPASAVSTLIAGPSASFPVAGSPLFVATGDFNGDGIPDLVTADFDSPGTVSVLLGVGDGTFGARATYAAGNAPRAIAVDDFNNDGVLDLAVTNNGDNTVSILLGRGDGSFAPQTAFSTGVSPTSIAAGDFNGDGKTDLAVADFNDGDVAILLGNGDGTFGAMTRAATGSNPFSVRVADFNGDGHPDLAVACENGGASVLLGNGDGTFQPQMTYPAGNLPTAVVTGDFNGDGKTDLAVANYDGNTVSVLLGQGDGTFAQQTVYATGNGPFFLSAADVNGDGKLDLVVANRGSNMLSVLPGNGDGSFQPQQLHPAGNSPGAAIVADLNGDGLLDTVAANSGDGAVGVLLGAETETATLVPVAVVGTGTHSVIASYPGDNERAPSQSSGVALTALMGSTITTLSTSANPANAGQSVTLTATIAANASFMPTGSVSFLNGATPVGSSAVNTSGVATLSVSSLPVGANSITAVYSGDMNFAPSTSTAVTETILAITPPDFTISANPPASTVGLSSTTTYQIAIASVNGSFDTPVALTISGLPTGITAAFNPSSVTPGGGTATTTLTLQRNSQKTMLVAPEFNSAAPFWAIGAGLLLLPLGCIRRFRSRLHHGGAAALLIVLSAAALFAVSGCSAPDFKNQLGAPQYMTITGAGGSVQHTTVIELQFK